MDRRGVLKGMAATIALQSNLVQRLGASAAPTAPFSRMRPGDAGWPSAANWATLNEAVGGISNWATRSVARVGQ